MMPNRLDHETRPPHNISAAESQHRVPARLEKRRPLQIGSASRVVRLVIDLDNEPTSATHKIHDERPDSVMPSE